MASRSTCGHSESFFSFCEPLLTFPDVRLCGYPPFYDERDAVLFELIMKGKFEFDERYWKDISVDARNIVSNMLQVMAYPVPLLHCRLTP
jgi:hypothetical protein